MPRRNFSFLLVAFAVSLICHQKVQHNRYGRALSDAMQQIERRHLEKIDQKDLFEGAMEGIVRRLEREYDDRYSDFITPEKLQRFHEVLDQQFGGVGMEVSLDRKTKQLTVISPLVDSPAYMAGIRAGDKILRIDGNSTQGLSLKDAVARMRGRPGQPITLTVLHEGDQEPVEVTIERAIIHVNTVLGDTREPDGSWNFFLEGYERIGYLRIITFAEDTAEELREAIDWLLEHDMQGLILDLRDDPGGLLRAATEVCDMFIQSGVIVTTRGRDKKIAKEWKASKNGTFPSFSMAILVNKDSASASEIVAACLQDHLRAVVVGQRTWGKGTVQEVITLQGERGALKLTTASYWRPTGKNIHRTKNAKQGDWGVTPNEGYEVLVEGKQLIRLRLWRLHRDKPLGSGEQPDRNGSEPFVDRQLQRAVEYILGKVGGKRVVSGQ